MKRKHPLNLSLTIWLTIFLGSGLLSCSTSHAPTMIGRQIADDRTASVVADPQVIGAEIDRVMAARDPQVKNAELTLRRTKPPTALDRCPAVLKDQNSFGQRIGYFVKQDLSPQTVHHWPVPLDDGSPTVEELYELSDHPVAVGLSSNPMCKVTPASLYESIGHMAINQVTTAQRAQASELITRYRALQVKAVAGDPVAIAALGALLAPPKSQNPDLLPGLLAHAAYKILTRSDFYVAPDVKTIESGNALFVKVGKARRASPFSAADLGAVILNTPIETLSRSFNIAFNRIPDVETIGMANQFVDDYNNFREMAQSGDPGGGEQLTGLWTRLMDCIAYGESLTIPNTKRAKAIADKNFPFDENGNPGKLIGDQTHPGEGDGIEYYMDSEGNGTIALTIGLFQFSPVAYANQYPCVQYWNEHFPTCPIPLKPHGINDDTKLQMMRAVASSLQTYNAACGVHKIVESFFTQVNTTGATRTHLDNILPSGDLKDPSQRCVSLHFRSGLSFNHFGPLQNSVGNNLNKVLSCVYHH